MDYSTFFYTLIQIFHNFGAAFVVGGSIIVQVMPEHSTFAYKKIAWLVLIGWLLQGLSGGSFGAISYITHGKFPDLSGIAKFSLYLKIICTLLGFSLTATYIKLADTWSESQGRLVWRWIMGSAVTALTSAAILRWYS